MIEDLEARAERQIEACQDYGGVIERNGLLILCRAMATALTILLALYRQAKANAR